tara:strand:+ start:140 stop:472 length:333 start_codon:yes stop_codon:yes gene_type:complete
MGNNPSKTNITYKDVHGYENTTTKKYTKFPYDMSECRFRDREDIELDVRNPFSGESYRLTPIEESVYTKIMRAQLESPDYFMDSDAQKVVRKGLDWFRSNNAEAYMKLLD